MPVGEWTLSGQAALVTGETRGLGKEFVWALAAADRAQLERGLEGRP